MLYSVLTILQYHSKGKKKKNLLTCQLHQREGREKTFAWREKCQCSKESSTKETDRHKSKCRGDITASNHCMSVKRDVGQERCSTLKNTKVSQGH